MRPKLAIFRLSQTEIIHLNRYFPSETDGNKWPQNAIFRLSQTENNIYDIIHTYMSRNKMFTTLMVNTHGKYVNIFIQNRLVVLLIMRTKPATFPSVIISLDSCVINTLSLLKFRISCKQYTILMLLKQIYTQLQLNEGNLSRSDNFTYIF